MFFHLPTELGIGVTIPMRVSGISSKINILGKNQYILGRGPVDYLPLIPVVHFIYNGKLKLATSPAID